jgi:hypothetical protein
MKMSEHCNQYGGVARYYPGTELDDQGSIPLRGIASLFIMSKLTVEGIGTDHSPSIYC